MLELDGVEIILQGEATPLKAAYRLHSKYAQEGTEEEPRQGTSPEMLLALCSMSAVQLLDPEEGGGYKYYLILNRVMVELPPGSQFKIQIIVKATKAWKSST